MYNFSFNGQWLTDFRGLSAKRPPIEIAQRDFKTIDLAGKSGADIVDFGRYKNLDIQREINFGYNELLDSIHYRIAEWLLSNPGYQEFEDTDHPGLVTYAAVTGLSEAEKKLNRIFRTTVSMTRQPFWFSKDGLEYLPGANNGTTRSITLVNPYAFDSRPLIKLTLSNGALSDSGKLYFRYKIYDDLDTDNGTTIDMVLSGLQGTVGYYNYVLIDIENGVIAEYQQGGTFVQFVKTVDGYDPPLNKLVIPGNKKVYFGIVGYQSNCSKAEYMPRWRTL